MRAVTGKKRYHVERQETRVDRRARRMRTLLQHALLELLRQKRFDSITIQEITERADVNRTTFYAYFPDKYALLDATLRAQFQQTLADRFPATGGRWDAASVRLLIRSSYEFLTEVKRLCKPFDTQMELLVAKLAQSELTAILSAWLGHAGGSRAPARVRLKTIISATSWVILGTVIEWAFQQTLDEETLTPDEITDQVFLILTEGVARLAPDLAP
jgi:AcrR family transcriptional regulator